MTRHNYHVDRRDIGSVEALIDAFDVRGTEFERAIRLALTLHDQAFILYVDHVNQPSLSPLDDAFTFNVQTGELVLFTEEPQVLLSAILEMAMFLRGFETLLESGEEWQVQVTIGAWRRVRYDLESRFSAVPRPIWQVAIEPDALGQYNMASFSTAAYLASCPNVEVAFPPGTNAMIIDAYRRMSRIMDAIALDIGLEDHEQFNRRLRRALDWIAESLLPDSSPSPFDDLLGPEGFNDAFFEDLPDDTAR